MHQVDEEGKAVSTSRGHAKIPQTGSAPAGLVDTRSPSYTATPPQQSAATSAPVEGRFVSSYGHKSRGKSLYLRALGGGGESIKSFKSSQTSLVASERRSTWGAINQMLFRTVNEDFEHSKLSKWAVMAIVFFNVSGGPWGSEEIFQHGPLPGILAVLLVAFFWSYGQIQITSELGSAFPVNGGYSLWVTEAFGPFWGFLESYWSWVSGVVDNAVYPVLLFDGVKNFFPENVGTLSNEAQYFFKVAIIFLLAIPNFVSTSGTGQMLQVLGIVQMLPFLLFLVVALPKMNFEVFTQTDLISTSQGQMPTALRTGTANLNVEGTNSGKGGPPVNGAINGAIGNFSDNFFAKIFSADFLCVIYWNLSGWDCVSTVAGEIENPEKNLAPALKYSLILTVLQYVLILSAAAGVTCSCSSINSASTVFDLAAPEDRPLDNLYGQSSSTRPTPQISMPTRRTNPLSFSSGPAFFTSTLMSPSSSSLSSYLPTSPFLSTTRLDGDPVSVVQGEPSSSSSTSRSKIFPVPDLEDRGWRTWRDGSLPDIVKNTCGPWIGGALLIANLIGNAGMFCAELMEDSYQLEGLAAADVIPRWTRLDWKHPVWGTPCIAMIPSLYFCVLCVSFDFSQILAVNNFFSASAALLEFLAFVEFRRSRPDMERPYRASDFVLYFVLPVAFLFGCVVLWKAYEKVPVVNAVLMFLAFPLARILALRFESLYLKDAPTTVS
ncbi:unnamed protein product [Amoebophrya sp. A25]|nr:unnamed protein product [Amoebophrya sp. A25]|eukprot:GSA25T00000932001.1